MLRPSSIRYIFEARISVRGVLVQEVLAVVGIAIGVALLFSSQVSRVSLDSAVAQPNNWLIDGAQVQLQARSFRGFPDRLLTEVRRIPGVNIALPILERRVTVIGPRGKRPILMVGVDPSSMKLSGKLDHRFSDRQLSRIDAIALPTPLAGEIGSGPLEPARVEIGSRFVKTLVGTTLGERQIGSLIRSPIAVTSIDYTRRMTDEPRALTRIFVRYQPSRAQAVRTALAALARKWSVNLEPSTFESRLFATATGPENTSELLLSAISALVGFLFVLVTVPSRRKLIEDLHLHGYTPWMIVQVSVVNALVLGVLGCGLGLALGDVLSLVLFNATPGYLTFAFPVGSTRIVTWQTIAFSAAAAMVAAVAGVLWPFREILSRPRWRARRRAPGRAWSVAALLVTAALCLAVTTYTLLYDARIALIGNVALVIALVCMLPLAFGVAVTVFTRLSSMLDDVGSGLAVSELRSSPSRVRYLAIAGTAALAVFGAVEFGGTEANLTQGLQSSIVGMDSSAGIWIVPAGGSSLQATVPFAPLNTGRLASIPGVRGVSVYRGSFLDWGERRVWVIAPGAGVQHPIPDGQILQGSPTEATALLRKGSWAVLSDGVAREHHLRLGDRFTLPSPQSATFRLAATTTDLGWPPGTVIMSAASYAAAWQSNAPSAYEVQTSRPAVTVRPVIRHALGAGFSVQTSRERELRHYAAARQGLSRLTEIRMLILVAAIVVIVAEMSAMISSRREQIAALKSLGISEGALWRSWIWETSVVLSSGCALGAVFGLYAQLLGSHFLSTITGFPIVFAMEGNVAVASFALVTATTVVALAIRGYRVVCVRPPVGVG